MIYAILTTSLIQSHYDIRKQQYITGITNNIRQLQKIKDIGKIIIVENNGNIKSFLDDFNVDVLYTDNNSINSTNKGLRELMDILDVIKKFDMNDDDFVIKVTGRYIIDHQCNLIDTINNYDINGIDCIIKYGSHNDDRVVNRSNDCITGLIGMKVGYIKQINTNVTDECIEWEWANVANKIPDDRIIMLDEIGIHVIGLHQPDDNVKSKK
jgi:hypothetical protein